MQKENPFRKRPCRICRRWFTPNPRLKTRQMTCGNPGCKKEWHRRKCAEWNGKNTDYFRSNYLQDKLDAARQYGTSPRVLSKNRLKSGLPHCFVQEVIGIQHLIIMEYFGQLLMKRFKEVFGSQLVVNTRQLWRLP